MTTLAHTTASSSSSDAEVRDHASRVNEMADRLGRLALLDEPERADRLVELILDEHSVGDTRFLDLTAVRLEAWTVLARRDFRAARVVAASYDAACRRLPPEIDFRRVHAAQRALRGDLPEGVRETYAVIMPRLAYLVRLPELSSARRSARRPLSSLPPSRT